MVLAAEGASLQADSEAVCLSKEAIRQFSTFSWLLLPSEHHDIPRLWGGVPPRHLSQQHATAPSSELHPKEPLLPADQHQAGAQTGPPTSKPAHNTTGAGQLPVSDQMIRTLAQNLRPPVDASASEGTPAGVPPVARVPPADHVPSAPPAANRKRQRVDEPAARASAQPGRVQAPAADTARPAAPDQQPSRLQQGLSGQKPNSGQGAPAAPPPLVGGRGTARKPPRPPQHPGKPRGQRGRRQPGAHSGQRRQPGPQLNGLQQPQRRPEVPKRMGRARQWSSIPAARHKYYLSKLGCEAQMNHAELTRFKELQEQVFEEQAQFKAGRDAQGRSDQERFAFLDSRAGNQIEACLSRKRNRVRAYPRYWQHHSQEVCLDVDQLREHSAQSQLTHVHTLTSGAEPEAHGRLTVPPAGTDISLGKDWLGRAGHKGTPLPLSMDLEAHDMAEREGVHALASASALTELAQLLPSSSFSRGFEIPVQVRPMGGPMGDRKVVIMDKPFLKRTMTLRDKHALLYKHALAHGCYAGSAALQADEADKELQDELESELFGTDDAGPSSAATSEAGANGPHNPGNDSSTARQDTEDASGRQVTPSRRVRHDLWQLHGLRIITRSHTYAASHVSPELQQAEGGPTAQRATKGVVMRAKMEYQGLGEEDREEVTLEEQAAWWLALKLRPGSSLLVGRTAVRESRLVHVSTLTEEDVAGGCQADFLGNLLGKLIGTMQFWAHGRYLLSHAPNADVIACFRELPKQHVPSRPKALPEGMPPEGAGGDFDLWAAHESAGATDTTTVPYVPKVWHAMDAEVPQIPHTFRVKSKQAQGQAVGGGRTKKSRQRKMGPSSDTRNGGADWDQVGDAMFDDTAKQDYAQQVAEEI